jgi:broad specificity phosphatase PhoE
MKPLLLVRHANPEIVETIPAQDWSLSELGKLRAQRLAQMLEPYKLEAVVSSHEPKAQKTADIIAAHLALEKQLAINLHEHERTHVPFYSPEEFQHTMQEFFARPEALVFGSETARRTLTRFSFAVRSVMLSSAGRSVAIVTHGTVMSLFVSELTGCDGFRFWKQLGLPACAVLDVESRQVLELIHLK